MRACTVDGERVRLSERVAEKEGEGRKQERQGGDYGILWSTVTRVIRLGEREWRARWESMKR